MNSSLPPPSSSPPPSPSPSSLPANASVVPDGVVPVRRARRSSPGVTLWSGRLVAGALVAAGLAGLVAARPGAVLLSVIGWVGMSGQTVVSALALCAGVGVWGLTRLRRENMRLEAEVATRTRALRLSEARFRGIFEHAVEGIFQSSPEGRSLHVNPAMARLCGYERPEEMTTTLTDLNTQFYVQPGRRAEVNAELERRGALVGVESEIRRRDGTTFWGSENVCVLRDPETDRTIYLGSILDVTERRAAGERLRAAMRAAEAADRAKSEFLANMSHELRTPLHAILGFARLLGRDPAADAHVRERLAIIEGSGEHLLSLINEVLDYSKIEAGKVELRPGPCNLPGLLVSLGDVFRQRAAEKGLAFHVDAAVTSAGNGGGELPRMVRADEAKLRQVLFNLLGNAVKFTTRGEAKLRVVRGAQERIEFSVEDTGIGIAPEHLEHIFLPFHQAGSSGGGGSGGNGPPPPVVAQQQGTGLGLSISKRLVGLMGGTLQVESRPGNGSRFFFGLELPELVAAGADVHPTTAIVPAVTGYVGPRRHVLVVDDEALNRRLAVELLTALGFRVSEAASGEECLARFAAANNPGPGPDRATFNQPDLVLLDLRMASMDGLETARRLRAGAPGANVKILASTAGDTGPGRAAALAAGCDGFLPKPLDFTGLQDTLARLLDLEWRTWANGDGGRGPPATTAAVPTAVVAQPLATQPAPPTLPDRGELDALLALTMQGDVLALRARLRALAERAPPECTAFLTELETLAARFQLGRITETLNHARAGTAWCAGEG